jgi:hypothetical protein
VGFPFRSLLPLVAEAVVSESSLWKLRLPGFRALHVSSPLTSPDGVGYAARLGAPRPPSALGNRDSGFLDVGAPPPRSRPRVQIQERAQRYLNTPSGPWPQFLQPMNGVGFPATFGEQKDSSRCQDWHLSGISMQFLWRAIRINISCHMPLILYQWIYRITSLRFAERGLLTYSQLDTY